ncbi:MAG TPA: Dna2/Cas4 domain-containing protein [Blastocatellia bacterium]|nr:Dna2/Cas4 domain-containing protein [Blastocatellia bacterium]
MSSAPAASPEQLPARMINEFSYCPRLFYLEYVQHEWDHSADTLEGKFVHRRVDSQSGAAPAADQVDETARIHARSVDVGSDALGAIAKIDLLEGENGWVTPVETTSAARRPTYPSERGSLNGCSSVFRDCCCARTATTATKA